MFPQATSSRRNSLTGVTGSPEPSTISQAREGWAMRFVAIETGPDQWLSASVRATAAHPRGHRGERCNRAGFGGVESARCGP